MLILLDIKNYNNFENIKYELDFFLKRRGYSLNKIKEVKEVHRQEQIIGIRSYYKEMYRKYEKD